ncbi:uncharacterized protein LOC108630651 isoform X1 [Ceratina calcarata]|uniref:Uncharacterized protein LOC108630651 isoform X1 n=1 Tax=Ceratina calcarata TaxID=156304 RepID=A0AAJ7ND72_9HYME|nr:uncharacterized protein LOC108630651 isoform X1 [Ceratina calcarata]XP_026674172.1 uncharacterized protein LOC108630651 isoform X1 [Ceratina calcarata]XP_026674173.1 uncharacterized protein LOC108630651 isoform X1 [Ceratina calcarata]
MLEQTDRQNGSLLCCENLKQVSIALKKGRTVESKAMDFILTILSCIVLNIDHRTLLHVSGYGFSNRRLKVLRKDLEDLLYFHTKYFNSLIIDLLLDTLKKEINCHYKCVKLNTGEATSIRSWNRVIFRRKVKAVIRFLVFRKMKTSSHFRYANDTIDWPLFKEKINKTLNIKTNLPIRDLRINKKVWSEKKYLEYDDRNKPDDSITSLTNFYFAIVGCVFIYLLFCVFYPVLLNAMRVFSEIVLWLVSFNSGGLFY